MKDTAFNGYCRIASGSGSMIIVFEKGNIRLAEYNSLEGDSALERIFQSGPATVDAVLHDLSAAQLDLAVEFSPLALVKSKRRRLKTDEKWSDGVIKPEHRIPQDFSSTSLKKEIPDTGTLENHTGHHIPAGKSMVKHEISNILAPDDNASLLSRELDALDAMDIEDMAAKFRANCRLMMERLDLEHLIDGNSGKDAP
jgi:hypothetical protein